MFVQVPGLMNVKSIGASSTNNFALDQSGQVWIWYQDPASPQFKKIVRQEQDIRQINSGYQANHSFAVDEKGIAWTWGSNNDV